MRGRDRGNVVLSIITLIVLVTIAGGAFAWFYLRAPSPPTPAETATGGAPVGSSDGADRGETPAPGGDPIENPGDGGATAETILFPGVVLDALGTPLARAKISSGPFPSKDEIVVLTDDRGVFEISLPADASPMVRMEAAGHYSQVVELERTPDLPYLLFLGGAIRGVVRGPRRAESGEVEDAPVPSVSIEIAGREGWFHEVTTDADGKYAVVAPPGAVVLTVRSAEFADERLLDVEAIRDGEVVRDILLRPGVQVDLTVSGDQEMVAGAHVRALTDLGQEGEGTTDGVGKLTFAGLTQGNGRLVIVTPGYQAELHSLVLGDNRLLIRRWVTLQRSTPFTLEVVDSAGDPRPDANVRIRLDQIDLVTASAGDLQALQVLGPDRTYSIEVVAPDAPRVQVRFRIPTDGPPYLRVILPKGGRFRGRVVDARDRPVAGAGVLISSVAGNEAHLGPPRLTSTAADGSFRTELFAPGPYRVQVHHPRLGRVGVDTKMVEGEDQDLGAIQLEAGSP